MMRPCTAMPMAPFADSSRRRGERRLRTSARGSTSGSATDGRGSGLALYLRGRIVHNNVQYCFGGQAPGRRNFRSSGRRIDGMLGLPFAIVQRFTGTSDYDLVKTMSRALARGAPPDHVLGADLQ